MRHALAALASLSLLAAAPAARAGEEPAPEIARAAAPPQATGHAHTLRTIPEACVRLQGEFTGDAAAPYRFQPVRTSGSCQARARVVDARKAGAPGAGWVLNDRIRVPSAACPGQQAVVRVWRQDRDAKAPALDAQGKSRIYLEEGLQRAKAGKLAALPVYAVSMALEGKACR
jgi:hypothetical protein